MQTDFTIYVLSLSFSHLCLESNHGFSTVGLQMRRETVWK